MVGVPAIFKELMGEVLTLGLIIEYIIHVRHGVFPKTQQKFLTK
jgi:hypothetical protein